MTRQTVDDDALQMHLDAELGADEEARVLAALHEAPELQTQLEAYGRVGELIRAHETAQLEAVAVDSDALFSAIERDIAKVIPVDFSRTPAARRTQGTASVGRITRFAVGTTGILALAAGLALAFRSTDSLQQMSSAVQNQPMRPDLVTSSVRARPQLRGSRIVDVDFGTRTGTYFTVPGETGESLAVIWIDDAPSESP